MAWLDLLEEEGAEAQLLVVLMPRRIPTNFTLHSGSVYVSDFDFGHVNAVSVDGEALTEGTSDALSAAEFYYDRSLEKLYVRTSGGVDPDTLNTVATYELYVATKDEHWNRVPTDDSTRVVYYEPLILRSPQVKATISETLFGFMPVQTSQITLSNAPHIFEKHLYDSSFNRGLIKVYHTLRATVGDDLETENIKLIYDGLMSNVGYSGGQVTIKTFDSVDELRLEYRNSDESFYSATLFPAIDPNAVGGPIRYVYGVVDGFVPVNVDYVLEAPTTGDNRVWCVIGEQNNLANLTKTVGGGVHTATRTFLTSVTGLRVGDSVHMDRAVGTDEYVYITAVGVNYIDHVALSGGAMVSGDDVARSFVGAVSIIQNDVEYKAMFARDFTTSPALSGGTAGFTFDASLEANLSMPETLSPNDKVYVRVYGRENDLTLGGAFGSNDSESGNITKPAMVILDLLKRALLIPESRLNASSFTALLSSRTDALGFAIPESSTGQFPEVKNILIDILRSSLVKLYLDGDNLWTVAAIGPLPAEDKSIDDTEILDGSFDYDFDYSDILSDVVVEYATREIGEILNSTDTALSVTATSEVASYLHQIQKQETFKSLHFKTADAQTLANRLSYIFGDRSGKVSFSTKNRFFDTAIDDTIEVSRTKLPGFEYDEDVEQDRSLAVVSTQKGLRSVVIDLDDQKGIQDNSGSW